MEWHYTENGQKFGPVSEADLLALAGSGAVRAETLVWHAGMPDWRPFREAGPGSDTPTRACSSCGKVFPFVDLAVFGDAAVCGDCKPGWVQRMMQGMAPARAQHFVYGGFWLRLVAVVIDTLITSVVVGVVDFLVGVKTIFSTARGLDSVAATVVYLLGMLGGLAYSVYFLTSSGATPGKMAMGLKVVKPDGSLISMPQAVGRFFGYYLSTFLLGIGYIMAAFDDEKRALHDRMAGTRVIRTRE